jgi:hypothetical protein
MINALTGNTYTGTNYELLAGLGFADGHRFSTFNQAMKLGINPKAMKGIKKVATLKFCKEVEDVLGKKILDVKFFNVFDYEDICKRQRAYESTIQSNVA